MTHNKRDFKALQQEFKLSFGEATVKVQTIPKGFAKGYKGQAVPPAVKELMNSLDAVEDLAFIMR